MNVTGAQNTGGIVGYAGTCKILDCENMGDVSMNSAWMGGKYGGHDVGGIAGFAFISSGVEGAGIYNCFNNGNVTGKNSVGVAVGYYCRKCLACSDVERECRSEHPQHISVFLLVLQQLYYLVDVLAEGCLSRSACAEREGVSCLFPFVKAPCVHVDALFAVFGASADHQLALFKTSCFDRMDPFTIPYRNGIHPGLLAHMPLSVDLEVFRIYRKRVKVKRRHTILWRFFESAVW